MKHQYLRSLQRYGDQTTLGQLKNMFANIRLQSLRLIWDYTLQNKESSIEFGSAGHATQSINQCNATDESRKEGLDMLARINNKNNKEGRIGTLRQYHGIALRLLFDSSIYIKELITLRQCKKINDNKTHKGTKIVLTDTAFRWTLWPFFISP